MLTRAAQKGSRRAATVRERLPRGALRTVGLGDGPNDAPFLNVVDVPILIPSALLEQLRKAAPRGRVAAQAGPAGWNQAVLELLEEPGGSGR